MKSNKKFLISGIVLTLITILSVIMVSSYKNIYNNAQNIKSDEYGYEYYYIDRLIPRSNIYIYKELKNSQAGTEVNYKDLYGLNTILRIFKENSEKYHDQITLKFENSGEYYDMDYDNLFYNIENEVKGGYKNLEYYIVDRNTGTSVSNSDNNLSLFIESKEDKELNELKDKYNYYKVISYDENGKAAILNSNTNDINESLDEKVYMNDEEVNLNPKNATVVYGVAKNLKYTNDFIYNNRIHGDNYKIGMSSLKYIIPSILGMFIISLFISYKRVNEDTILGKILNWPIEILWILGICGVTSLVGLPYIINYTIDNRVIVEALNSLGFSENAVGYGMNIFSILYWMLILLIPFGVIQIIKYILGKGIIKYTKENTLIGIIVVYLFKKLRILVESINSIDLKKDGDRYLFKIVLINFIIVSLLCVLWFSGIIGTIIYSIALFFVLRKYMIELRVKYEILLDASNKIAEGNLDVEINEDLKIFNPVKEELKKIQKGFKRAVEEEIKSQNMKTELITNVSHDLKTPLTSIITYVDLLKDENISEEDRKIYIETIDNKAKRLKGLIEDLFEVSKASSENIQLDIVNLDIVELIKQVEMEFEKDLEVRKLVTKWKGEEEKIIVPLDSQKTFRIFENLLGNITKYGMEGSRVYITLIDKEEEVSVTLKNISASEIDYNEEDILERFKRGDKSRNTEGSGLGLAIVKSFIEAQGGRFNLSLDGDLFKVEVIFKKQQN